MGSYQGSQKKSNCASLLKNVAVAEVVEVVDVVEVDVLALLPAAAVEERLSCAAKQVAISH